MGRAIILMMDSFGIGGAPDAELFEDKGADTFGHIAQANLGLNIPNLIKLGLLKAATEAVGHEAPIGIQDPAKIKLKSKYIVKIITIPATANSAPTPWLTALKISSPKVSTGGSFFSRVRSFASILRSCFAVRIISISRLQFAHNRVI